MPIDEGWRLVKDAFQKTVAGGAFDYSQFPLQDLQAPAIGRVQAQGMVLEEVEALIQEIRDVDTEARSWPPAINPPGWPPAPPAPPPPAAVGT
jgi:hypothetical protein